MGSLDVESDSITIIDKMNKAYFKESVDDLLAGFPATESNLQSLLLGRVFMPGSDSVDATDFEVRVCDAPGLWTAGGMIESHSLDYSFAFRSPGLLKALAVKVGSGSPVSIAYGEEVKTDYSPFASYTSVMADKLKSPVEVALEWNFGKAVWNSPECCGVPFKGSVGIQPYLSGRCCENAR